MYYSRAANPSHHGGRPQNREPVDNHYLQTLANQQTAFIIEQDRQYAEQLAHTYRDDELQIATDYQLAVQLARERWASPRPDMDQEMALQMSRERSASPPRNQQRALSPASFVGEDGVLGPTDPMEEEERRTPNCVICGDATTNRTSVGMTCGHHMCLDDVVHLFEHAMTDETLFPPRCCRTHEIPVDAARALLGDRYPRGFDARAVELRTVDRTYCHVPECSTFIAREHMTNDVAVCPTCEEWTCTLCKQAGHRRGECPRDPAQQQLEAIAEQNGWRRCRDCRSIVERTHGCNHMTCRCGHQFCYLCGGQWPNCDCERYDNDLLFDRAAQVANRPRRRALQVPAAMPNEEGDPAEQNRRLREFQRHAPAHVIQPAPARIFDARAPVQASRHRRRHRNGHHGRNRNAIQHADNLITDLRRTQAAHRRARDHAEEGRARRFAAMPLRLADVHDIAAHLRENHECAHVGRWRRFHAGLNRCEICHRVKANPAVGECPTCFLQACYYCRRHRMREGE